MQVSRWGQECHWKGGKGIDLWPSWQDQNPVINTMRLAPRWRLVTSLLLVQVFSLSLFTHGHHGTIVHIPSPSQGICIRVDKIWNACREVRKIYRSTWLVWVINRFLVGRDNINIVWNFSIWNTEVYLLSNFKVDDLPLKSANPEKSLSHAWLTCNITAGSTLSL